MALWDETIIDLKYQSVPLLLCFWPLTASITFEVKNNRQNPRNFEQIYWKQKICWMYGLAVMMAVSMSTPIKNIDKI